MLLALKDAGWHNYSLFLADDGLLVGYLECADFDDARARMALTDVNARWQAEMSSLFADTEQPPDEGFTVLPEVFNLEDQLAAASGQQDPGNRMLSATSKLQKQARETGTPS
jgi:L-rhamnose mutarotase